MNMLDLYIGLLQIYDVVASQADSEEIINKLQEQNISYLKKIMEQNDTIIENQKKILKLLGGDTND